jgi:hypothetical protein
MKLDVNMVLLVTSMIIIAILIMYIHHTMPTADIVIEVPQVEQLAPILDARPSVYAERIPPPEYRPAPIREWKPPVPQQMGLLTSEGGDVKPLYGRASRTNRDRWHYWTTTGGENLYSLPVEVDGRKCEDDVGCNELFGNEQVSILGSEDQYKPTLYRVDNFF